MPRRIRGSKVIEQAEQRAINIKMISPTVELGSARSLESYVQSIEHLRRRLESYNSLLAQVDVAQAELLEREKALNRLTSDVLTDIASKYGKDSYEYHLAGGTRRSDRKRPIRKSQTTIDQQDTP
jgi:hypothetical protein